ncbi:MAG TPA: alpha/beta fold hydrolase [Candidatus Krumholzibacteria bacterium]|nr:alpha/beta fold hydrolase [Candidatus Krumholzibacteria bacterium]
MRNLTTRLLTGAVLLMALQGCSSTSGWYHLPAAEFDQIDYGYAMHTTRVRNIRVGYIDEGKGDVVLLIHGLGSNAKGWSRNIPALTGAGHRVIAVDLPGYGYSDKEPYKYSMSFYATVLGEVLTNLGIEKATWVGHSMGGQIAMTAALEQPERVARLVLISPAGFETFTDGEGDWMRRAVSSEFVQDTTIRNIAVNLKSNFHDAPAEADFMITDRIQVRGAKDFKAYCDAVSLNVGAMLDGPVKDRLGDITQPVLVLFGENDNLIPNRFLHGGRTRDVAEAGTALLPNARLVMVPSCGHFVQFEKPTETNDAVLAFLAR